MPYIVSPLLLQNVAQVLGIASLFMVYLDHVLAFPVIQPDHSLQFSFGWFDGDIRQTEPVSNVFFHIVAERDISFLIFPSNFPNFSIHNIP